ncbi:MAG TPA: ribonuclease HI family protein [Phycisphaerae bacterium]|nr:ribonuclease HI family protein [Phycisphaerae bacterium]
MSDKPLHVVVHTDGGAKGNPGPAGAGVVIRAGDDGQVLYEAGFFLGHATNNQAEYRGLLKGLKAAADLGASRVDVLSDSELLIRQMTGEYRVKSANLADLHRQARRLADGFDKCTFRHVSREKNAHADSLAGQAIRLRRNVRE